MFFIMEASQTHVKDLLYTYYDIIYIISCFLQIQRETDLFCPVPDCPEPTTQTCTGKNNLEKNPTQYTHLKMYTCVLWVMTVAKFLKKTKEMWKLNDKLPSTCFFSAVTLTFPRSMFNLFISLFLQTFRQAARSAHQCVCYRRTLKEQALKLMTMFLKRYKTQKHCSITLLLWVSDVFIFGLLIKNKNH